MKVLYIALALLLSCIVSVHAVSMQELQNSSRYELLHGFGESGKGGDGTYIDKESMQATNGRNGTKQIAVTQYVLMPAGDTIEEKQTVYSFDTKQSFANLIKRLEAHQLHPIKSCGLINRNMQVLRLQSVSINAITMTGPVTICKLRKNGSVWHPCLLTSALPVTYGRIDCTNAAMVCNLTT